MADTRASFVSIEGKRFGLGPGYLVVDGQRIYPNGGNTSRVALFDDFIGDVLADEWNAVETDTDATELVLAGGIGGVLRITAGNDDGNGVVLPDLAGVTSYLNWQASNGNLIFETRIKCSRITDCYIFVGFTDLITIEAPIISAGSANTITTNASDAVGWMFDTNMTADTWWLTGVKADVDATTQNTTIAPVADTYEVLRIEVSSSGVATFFRNGAPVGSPMSNALTAATDLTPVVLVSNQDGTSANTLDIDYIYVSMDRAAPGGAV